MSKARQDPGKQGPENGDDGVGDTQRDGGKTEGRAQRAEGQKGEHKGEEERRGG